MDFSRIGNHIINLDLYCHHSCVDQTLPEDKPLIYVVMMDVIFIDVAKHIL